MSNLNAFIDGYVESLLWASLAETDDTGGDEIYLDELASSIDDFSSDAQKATLVDCTRFLSIAGTFENLAQYAQAGADFFLTRQGHGTGFWDRPEIYGEERAQALAALAKDFPEVNPWWNWGNHKVEID